MLTDKQEIFCLEYCLGFNATRSALAAGYSENTASSIGWENLRKPEIIERIQELRNNDAKKLNITRERILKEYARLAFFDIRKIYDDSGALMNMKDIDSESAAAIVGVEVVEMGEFGEIKKVKMADKRAALDSMCKVLGFNEAEKRQLTGADGSPLFPTSIALVLPEGMDVNFPSNTDGDEQSDTAIQG